MLIFVGEKCCKAEAKQTECDVVIQPVEPGVEGPWGERLDDVSVMIPGNRLRSVIEQLQAMLPGVEANYYSIHGTRESDSDILTDLYTPG